MNLVHFTFLCLLLLFFLNNFGASVGDILSFWRYTLQIRVLGMKWKGGHCQF